MSLQLDNCAVFLSLLCGAIWNIITLRERTNECVEISYEIKHNFRWTRCRWWWAGTNNSAGNLLQFFFSIITSHTKKIVNAHNDRVNQRSACVREGGGMRCWARDEMWTHSEREIKKSGKTCSIVLNFPFWEISLHLIASISHQQPLNKHSEGEHPLSHLKSHFFTLNFIHWFFHNTRRQTPVSVKSSWNEMRVEHGKLAAKSAFSLLLLSWNNILIRISMSATWTVWIYCVTIAAVRCQRLSFSLGHFSTRRRVV